MYDVVTVMVKLLGETGEHHKAEMSPTHWTVPIPQLKLSAPLNAVELRRLGENSPSGNN